MSIHISCAPCCWGVDDPKNPYLPKWQMVLDEASQAGFKGIELGPYGYLPLDVPLVSGQLDKDGLNIIAGTIFDDLVSPENLENLKKAAHDICHFTTQLPQPAKLENQRYNTPYLVIIDWGHDERDYASGHPDKAPRLNTQQWNTMIEHIKIIADIAKSYGVRPVIHPHAGGYIEFADEIDQIAKDIPVEQAGFCLDTGHLYYSKMNPQEWLIKYKDRLDYVHFKDIDAAKYEDVMQRHIRFFEACAEGVMCPIGQGCLDYNDIYNTLNKLQYGGYITIEQEKDPRNVESTLEDLTKSRQFLASLGYK